MAIDSTSISKANTALQDAAQSIINGTTGKSSMDVNALVAALVGGKTAGLTVALSESAKKNNDQAAALGRVRTDLTALQNGLESLSNGTLLQKYAIKATGKGLTATTDKGAAAGSYQVDVKQIANQQSLVSGAFDAKQKLGTGTLTLGVGDKSMKLDITAQNNTPAGIAAAINGAANNPGVSATVVTGTDGAHLVLRSTASGSDKVINVGVDGVKDDNGLSKLAIASTADSKGGPSTIPKDDKNGWTQSAAAQDAILTVGGITARSAENTVSNVIAGITLTLTQESVGTSQSLSVTPDLEGQAKAVTNFVDLYNSVVSTMAAYSTFDKSQKKGEQGGTLLGDPTIAAIRNTMGRLASEGVRHGIGKVGLADLGVTFAPLGSKLPEGSLVIDQKRLNGVLQNSPATVAKVFNEVDGIGKQLSDELSGHLKKDGTFDRRFEGIDRDMKSLTKRQESLTNYAADLTSQYKAQFTALDALMAKMKNNSDYLTQLFGGAFSAGALAKK
ncbi:flagellar filament capping protein FliD [Burkholderia alba]|uniref:flagellar filament capping protein FliD n=1 Tax=Burkholderia alba TaxID=2683677 RepID=UPI002B060EF6|nr:flagellar filament capping protein FliD [Burkholderia alba]